jgi:hypothetical protein
MLTLANLTLEQHAGLTAALAEGHPRADVLALEGLDDAAFRAADAAWKEKLAEEGQDGPIFAAYRDKLAVAEDWLGRGREIPPLDADIAAWMGFLGAYAADGSPFDLLQGLGLGLNDLSRLSRKWQKRLAEDEKVRKQAAELARKNLKTAPKVRVSEAELKPFPWSKGKAEPEETRRDEPGAREILPIDDDFGLDQYASVSAELALDPKGAEKILARYGISRKGLGDIEGRWKDRIEADPELEKDWRRLYAFYHARFEAASKRKDAIVAEEASRRREEAREAPPPKPVFASTSLSLSIPRSALLPFVAGQAPPEISEASNDEPKVDPPKPSLGGTALALDVPRGPATPFEGPEAPKAPPNPKLLAGTALAVDVPKGPALPFQGGEAPESVRKPSAAEEEGNRARKKLGGTALAVDVPKGPVTPFDEGDKSSKHKENPLATLALGMDLQAIVKRVTEASGAAPPVPEEEPWAPALSLEQHASMTVEIAMGRDAAEVLARYRLTPEAKVRLDQHYREVVGASPEARATWDRAYRAYYEWLQKSG